ncbi:13578_t:CDS:2 [Ambispora gerdemannii]|uniref:13578_t:CDS:1 n=1 Tax=Ambispora gerdemannii TaxID=144530 RepID=A0A9N9F391_9GLOM|nr:13578_t:CDS:2 [Ambispora gerdemannii]
MSMTKFHADIRAMSIAIKLRNRARLQLKDPKVYMEINFPSTNTPPTPSIAIITTLKEKDYTSRIPRFDGIFRNRSRN